MIVREYSEDDLKHIKALHAGSGFRYAFPDVSRQEFFSRRVVADDARIAMAAFLKLSSEAFLVCDARWRTPAWRIEALRQLHHVCMEDAVERGVYETQAFLAPQVEKQFGKRLVRPISKGGFGWNRYHEEEWRCYTLEVER